MSWGDGARWGLLVGLMVCTIGAVGCGKDNDEPARTDDQPAAKSASTAPAASATSRQECLNRCAIAAERRFTAAHAESEQAFAVANDEADTKGALEMGEDIERITRRLDTANLETAKTQRRCEVKCSKMWN